MATYITTTELAERLHYNARYITQSLKDRVLLKVSLARSGRSGRKVLYIWRVIEDEMSLLEEEDMIQ